MQNSSTPRRSARHSLRGSDNLEEEGNHVCCAIEMAGCDYEGGEPEKEDEYCSKGRSSNLGNPCG